MDLIISLKFEFELIIIKGAFLNNTKQLKCFEDLLNNSRSKYRDWNKFYFQKGRWKIKIASSIKTIFWTIRDKNMKNMSQRMKIVLKNIKNIKRKNMVLNITPLKLDNLTVINARNIKKRVN